MFFFILALAWIARIWLQPVPVESWSEFLERAAIGPVPGAVVVDICHDLPPQDIRRAGIVGRSYGGYMTLTMASRHPSPGSRMDSSNRSLSRTAR